jgi:hypothetical protein
MSPGASQAPVKLAPVGSCARHLLPVDVPAAESRRVKLLKLAVEGHEKPFPAAKVERLLSCCVSMIRCIRQIFCISAPLRSIRSLFDPGNSVRETSLKNVPIQLSNLRRLHHLKASVCRILENHSRN